MACAQIGEVPGENEYAVTALLSLKRDDIAPLAPTYREVKSKTLYFLPALQVATQVFAMLRQSAEQRCRRKADVVKPFTMSLHLNTLAVVFDIVSAEIGLLCELAPTHATSMLQKLRKLCSTFLGPAGKSMAKKAVLLYLKKTVAYIDWTFKQFGLTAVLGSVAKSLEATFKTIKHNILSERSSGEVVSNGQEGDSTYPLKGKTDAEQYELSSENCINAQNLAPRATSTKRQRRSSSAIATLIAVAKREEYSQCNRTRKGARSGLRRRRKRTKLCR